MNNEELFGTPKKDPYGTQFIIWVTVFTLVVCFGGGAFMAWLTRSDEVKYVQDPKNGCQKRSEQDRPELPRKHCGKACKRYQVEYTYFCEREKKILIWSE